MGANFSALKDLGFVKSFNPRTRDGCEKRVRRIDDALTVSIHAPVMGANMAVNVMAWIGRFNPRTRDGCEKSHPIY